ncbi:DUF3592 domain-containing protein [Streptomyces resistomycificus]|uniref:DUF3592 domain-containing protein n=1 Tax=Streptomyces resistomycificus TaxID=67356 RepID=A0A0L8LDX1_9ACTN|nr:DUF3592 domain-containing protein [Streptomyces resistomycificus]KOG36473.1 hypothetical protein ADK37_13855 [Streptomyces resistomycificus]KUN92407.1 hypothetical protein AQJ84_33550 [Streptomyces resistomycificus]
MSQPWLTFVLLFAAGWLAYGARVVRRGLRERKGVRHLGVRGTRAKGEVVRGPRREGATLHPAQLRYQAGPARQTYRRAPLNADQHSLWVGCEVVVRYDPDDPRRVVVVRTQKTFNPETYLVNGVALCLFGVGLAVWAFV